MSNERQSHPTPGYIRTVFHLGLFGLLCLLFAQVHQSKSTWILGLKTFLAAVLPYYPALWASRLKSKKVVITLLIVVIVGNLYLLYMAVNPNR